MRSLLKDNRPVKLALWAAIITVAIALDQYTKYLAVTLLKPIGTYPLWEGVFHFTYVENRGAAFGMLSDKRWVFMILSTIAVLGIIIYLVVRCRQTPLFEGMMLAMIAAGGIGNMIDRIKVGFVVDFLDFTLINFAVFNVADSFVTVGAALMIVYLLVTEIKAAKKAPSQTTSQENQQ